MRELVIADLAADAAIALARSLGQPARGIGLDVTDHRALAAALSEVDVVVNTVGPFFRFGVPVLTAAIEAGRHYLDICDDWEPTLDMLDLDAAARAAGVTAVIGMGCTPGMSNLLAVRAAAELDTTTSVITGWNIEAAQPDERTTGTSAALVHGIQQITGTIRVTRAGRPVDEPPLRRIDIDYPGLGTRPTWTFGHPEPVTLPRSLGSVRSSVNVTFGRRGIVPLMKAVRWSVDHRLLTVQRAARLTQWAEDRLSAPDVHTLAGPDQLPPLFALATGTRDGVPATAATALCRFPGTSMGEVTGIPLAVATELITTGDAAPGVFAPEAVIDPAGFFAALAPHCPGDPSPADMTVTTRSWDPDASTAYQAAIDAAVRAM